MLLAIWLCALNSEKLLIPWLCKTAALIQISHSALIYLRSSNVWQYSYWLSLYCLCICTRHPRRIVDWFTSSSAKRGCIVLPIHPDDVEIMGRFSTILKVYDLHKLKLNDFCKWTSKAIVNGSFSIKHLLLYESTALVIFAAKRGNKVEF